MQTLHSSQDHCNKPPEQNFVSEFSLSDLANVHLATPSSSTVNDSTSEVQEGTVQRVEGDAVSLSIAGLSLTDLASLQTANLMTHEEMSHSSTDPTLSELAGMHMSTQPSETDHSNYEDTTTSSINLPLLDMNPQLASLDFTTGFATPKTGSTLSLSQLASLGSTSTSSKSSKLTTSKLIPFQTNTSGLATLAAVHLNSLKNDNVTNSTDLCSLKPPPGLVSPNTSVVNSSQYTSLANIVDKLKIQDINSADASVFASIICMKEREQPRGLIKRHRHLKRKFWRALINPHRTHIPFFTFTTPSPDDYVLKKQKQVFDS